MLRDAFSQIHKYDSLQKPLGTVNFITVYFTFSSFLFFGEVVQVMVRVETAAEGASRQQELVQVCSGAEDEWAGFLMSKGASGAEDE